MTFLSLFCAYFGPLRVSYIFRMAPKTYLFSTISNEAVGPLVFPARDCADLSADDGDTPED